MPERDVQLTMIDGRDALLMVLVKPGRTDGSVAVDAHCDGLDKMQAAKILAYIAREWKAEAEATAATREEMRRAPGEPRTRVPSSLAQVIKESGKPVHSTREENNRG